MAAVSNFRARFALGGDRLSALPDDLLLQILVLLPLIEAVRTCVLSRRWTALWTHVRRLDFFDTEVGDGDGEGRPGRFAGLVDGVLSRVAGLGRVPRCVRIRLHRAANVDARRITAWARIAAERLITAGDFHLGVVVARREGKQPADDGQQEHGHERAVAPAGAVVELPCFEGARFISLNLRDRTLQLALPPAGVFASLTRLVLVCVTLAADGAGASLGDVVSSRCPCLESLEVASLHGAAELVIHSASLLLICVSLVAELRLLRVVAPRLRALGVESCFLESQGAAVHVAARKLAVVHWFDCCPEQTYVGAIDHLELLAVGEVPLAFLGWQGGVQFHTNFDMILRHFRRTDLLELRVPIDPELVGHKQLMERIVLPQYSDLNLFVEPSRHMFGESMLTLLKRCIGVTTLCVDLCKRKGDMSCLSSCIWDHPPSWRNQTIWFDSLKEVVVRDFGDTSTHEVDIFSFIFRRATSLQKIAIVLTEGVQLTHETFFRFEEYPVMYYLMKR